MDIKPLTSRSSPAQYERLAEDLVLGFDSGDSEAMQRINDHYQPNEPITRDSLRAKVRQRLDSVSNSEGEILALADAQFLVAGDYGFESMPKMVKHIDALTRENSSVSKFEAAVDAVISGDVATLESVARDSPELVHARSTRVHRATLLHYVSANGVENYRQKTPKNAVRVAETLLKAGAEVDALAETYGGGAEQTTLNLVVSSCHPAEAGVQEALVETLLDFGAAINGVEDNGSPLITALAFHYPDAAETLARRGAKVDSIVAAAGLGRQELVSSFTDSSGGLKTDVPLVEVSWLRLAKEPKANLELALVWAAMHRRTEVVRILLQKGVDVGASDQRRWTALHWAAYYGYLDILELLLEWKAPLEAMNEFDGTVLDQTIWCSVHGGPVQDYVPIIQMLLDAGAKVNPAWVTGNKTIDQMLRRYATMS